MKFYGKTLALRRGITLNINLLYECNLHCEYCSLLMPTGKRPRAKRKSLEEWKEFIENFTQEHRVKQVLVSGGEPTMLNYLPDLVNWLLKRGFHVLIFTNLYNAGVLTLIKPSYRLQIRANFHHSGDLLAFNSGYELLKKRYNIEVDEIEYKVLPYSTVKPLLKIEDFMEEMFRVSPDLKIYKSCYELYGGKC